MSSSFSSSSSSASRRRKKTKKENRTKHSKHGNSLNKTSKHQSSAKEGHRKKRRSGSREKRGRSSRRTREDASTGSDADLPPPRVGGARLGPSAPAGLLGPQAPSGLLDAASDASDISPPRQAVRREAPSGRLRGADGDLSLPCRSAADAAGARRPNTEGGDFSHARRLAERSRSRDQPVRQGNATGGKGKGREDDSDSGGSGKGSGKGKGKGKGKDGKGKGKDGKGKGGDEEEPVDMEEPNFEASGLLAVEDNAKNGVPLKFVQPPEARTPTTKWRLYCFTKGSDTPKILHVNKQPGFLFGKDRRVVDIPTDHQTCSKQHAVLHYRAGADGRVKPYIMDLESINGTLLNGTRIEAARYHELREKDVLKFGLSSREFVLLHGASTRNQAIDPKLLRSPSPE